jgi:AmmeMemoRadiSam system protein A
MHLADDQGRRLVDLARGTIAHALGGPPVAPPEGAWCARPAATFVTLTKRGRLHGCLGSVEPRRPLVEDVAQNALAAAFRDPRSVPLRADELPDLGVEVSLLSPLEPLEFADEEDALAKIRPHVDGIVLSWGPRRGTFLPQVWATLPDPHTFLSELKQKAGLPPHFWAPDIEIARFTLQKWSSGPEEILPRAGAPRARE